MKRLLVLCAIAACGEGAAPVAPAASELEPPKDAIAKVTENGPVKVTTRVWPGKPTLGDAIYLRLEIEAPAGISVAAPFQVGAEQIGRFKVPAFAEKKRGNHVEKQTYTLEATSSGRHRIPPLRLEMIDARAGAGSAGGKAQELLTDEIALEIAPVAAEVANADLKPLRDQLDARVGGVNPLAVGGIASGALVLVAGGLLLLRAARARQRIAKQRSAYDEAVAQLRALEDRGAPDVAAADEWFVELSAIVRRYLEHRYEIRAPELTTEEFLVVATARPELREDHRGLLTQFLERCDRVKFAGYRPDAAESLATLAAARGFVEDTRLRLAGAPGPSARGTGTPASTHPPASKPGAA